MRPQECQQGVIHRREEMTWHMLGEEQDCKSISRVSFAKGKR